MQSGPRAVRLAWPPFLLQVAWIATALGRTDRRLAPEEFDPAVAEREQWLGRKLPDRAPERRN
jgi:hypothetical protein